jgi:hypothetical protein
VLEFIADGRKIATLKKKNYYENLLKMPLKNSNQRMPHWFVESIELAIVFGRV